MESAMSKMGERAMRDDGESKANADLVLQCRVLALDEDGGEYETDRYWCGGDCPPMAKVTSDIACARKYTLRGALAAIRAIDSMKPSWLLAIDARTIGDVTVGVESFSGATR